MVFHRYSSEAESGSEGILVQRKSLPNAVVVSSTDPIQFNHRGVTVDATEKIIASLPM